jgi:Alkylmercury lyase
MDPTVEDLLLQRAAAGFPTPSRRRQGLPAPIRELHRRVLGHFAASGQAPLRAILSAWAAELGVGLQDALGRLVEADLVEANPATGHLAGAYPLVASPRGHQVRLPGGLTMEAYCAIDALGIPAMLDQDATITSRDPLIGRRSPSRSTTATHVGNRPQSWSATRPRPTDQPAMVEPRGRRPAAGAR